MTWKRWWWRWHGKHQRMTQIPSRLEKWKLLNGLGWNIHLIHWNISAPIHCWWHDIRRPIYHVYGCTTHICLVCLRRSSNRLAFDLVWFMFPYWLLNGYPYVYIFRKLSASLLANEWTKSQQNHNLYICLTCLFPISDSLFSAVILFISVNVTAPRLRHFC